MVIFSNKVNVEFPEIQCLESYFFFKIRQKKYKFVSKLNITFVIGGEDNNEIFFHDKKHINLQIGINREVLEKQPKDRMKYLSDTIFSFLKKIVFDNDSSQIIINLYEELLSEEYQFIVDVDKISDRKKDEKIVLKYLFEYDKAIVSIEGNGFIVQERYLPSYYPLIYFFKKLIRLDESIVIIGDYGDVGFVLRNGTINPFIIDRNEPFDAKKINTDIQLFNKFSLDNKMLMIGEKVIFERSDGERFYGERTFTKN